MICFGPAGLSNDPAGMIDNLKQNGLNICEIAFTHSVYMNNSKAKEIGEYAKKQGITLTIHAPYYINLTSEDKTKITASKKRILLCCERAHYLKAKDVVFHAAYYGKLSKEKVYDMVSEEIKDMQSVIKKNKWDVLLSPETTGKATQFGDIDELLSLSKDTGCSLCIDFAHIYARNVGKIDYDDVFSKIKNIPSIHAHFSGINFGDKGEKNHIPLTKPFFKPLGLHLKNWKKPAWIICEAPDPYGDALKMKNWFEEL